MIRVVELLNKRPPLIEVFSGEQNGVEWVVTIKLVKNLTFLEEKLVVCNFDGGKLLISIQYIAFDAEGNEKPYLFAGGMILKRF